MVLSKSPHALGKATFKVAFLLSLLVPWLTPASNSGTGPVVPQSKAYLAEGDENERPLSFEKRSFGCSEKIYAVTELQHFPAGKHEFSVRWIDPAQITREHTRYLFHIHNKETRLWSWLSLRRGAGAGMLQWLDPSAGLEEFIGLWTVKVDIDGKEIAKLTMEVNC